VGGRLLCREDDRGLPELVMVRSSTAVCLQSMGPAASPTAARIVFAVTERTTYAPAFLLERGQEHER
ncbi:MAG TPA: hypothetical protein VGR71_15715, partial [Nitrospira sp.]|nr:hypothetical protein [Nitrospira sp.]